MNEHTPLDSKGTSIDQLIKLLEGCNLGKYLQELAVNTITTQQTRIAQLENRLEIALEFDGVALQEARTKIEELEAALDEIRTHVNRYDSGYREVCFDFNKFRGDVYGMVSRALFSKEN